ncbi:MAG: hypothetical protein RR198_07255 [Oscillospiraceae bacterium]
MWRTPVYDRTLADVRQKNSKGYLNTSDLNRIENNIQVLSELLKSAVVPKSWQDGEIVYLSQLKRLENNIQTLLTCYPLPPTSPPLPFQPYTNYQQWNDIEHIINDIYSLFYANKGAVNFCSEISAGAQIGVI